MYITFKRYNNLQTFDHAHASINYDCATLTLSCGLSDMDDNSQSPGPTSASTSTSTTTGRSEVWKHFIKVKEGTKAMCTLCSKGLAYRGGTTNLRQHLTSQHPLRYNHQTPTKKDEASKQTTLDVFSKPRSCPNVQPKEITDRIVNMIALDLRPIHMVECEGFRNLLTYLEPGYKVPRQPHVTDIIRRKHEVGKEMLRARFKEASQVALTTDIWTSRATEAYITMSAHYVSVNWKLFSYVLETKGFPECHTGKATAEKLTAIAANFVLGDKVSAVVHDQAANMEVSLDILSSDMGWESLHCSAHCLQLCIKGRLSMNSIERLIGASRKLVGHFNHSAVVSEELKRWQVQMEMAEKKLVQECATRWNSTFYMLERLLELRWPVSAVLSDDRVTKRGDCSLDLNSGQWALAEELVTVLRPFEVATTFFSYKENASLSSVLPVLHGLIDSLQKEPSPSASESPAVRHFKQKISGEIKRRWQLDSPQLTSSLVLAPAVDPRFKQLKFLNTKAIEIVKSELESWMEAVDLVPDFKDTDVACEPPEK